MFGVQLRKPTKRNFEIKINYDVLLSKIINNLKPYWISLIKILKGDFNWFEEHSVSYSGVFLFTDGKFEMKSRQKIYAASLLHMYTILTNLTKRYLIEFVTRSGVYHVFTMKKSLVPQN